MKKLWKALAVMACASLFFGLTSCDSDDDKKGSSDPAKSIAVTADENYTAGSFYVGDEVTLTATPANVTGTVLWSTNNDEAVELNTKVGTTVKVTGLAVGTAVITAAIGDVKGTFSITVGEDLSSKTIESLPWSVEFPIMGSEGAINYSTSGNGHYNWGSMSGTATYAGLGFDGEFIYTDTSADKWDENELYAGKAGVFFNYYAGGETAVGECVKENASADVRGYITVYGTSIPSESAKSVKITINASYIPEKTNVSQIAIATPEWYVLGSQVLTETAGDYVFYVEPGKTFYVFNNGPKDSFMGVYAISAEESDHDPIEQTPGITSVTVTGPAQVSKDSNAQMSATVKVTYNADKTVTWSSSDATVATVDASTGVVTGVAAGTVTITATSTVDTTKSGEAEIEVVDGEVKPQVGTTYVYNFKAGNSAMTEGAFDCSSLVETGKAAASADGFVSWNTGWKKHDYGLQTADKAELYIKVAGNVLVGWTGYAGSGNIDVTYGDENTPLLTNVSAANAKDSTYKWFIYKGDETTLTIKRNNGTTYITELTIKPWTDEVPTVESVSITEDAKTTVEVGAEVATYKATVSTTYFANSLVTWSVTDSDGNDTTLATIGSETGVLTTTAAGNIKVVATSVLDSTKTASVNVEISSGTVITYEYKWTAATVHASNNGFNITGTVSDVIDGIIVDSYSLDAEAKKGIFADNGDGSHLKVFNSALYLKNDENHTISAEKPLTVKVTISANGNNISATAGKSKTALTASSNVWTFTMTSTEELISGTDVNTIIAAAKTAGQTTCSDVATANNYIPFYINGVASASSGQGYISSIVLTYGDKE